VTFSIIAFTVAIQGLSAGPVATLLGVRAARPNGVVLAGAHPFAVAVAAALASEKIPVRLVDSSDARCEDARRAGLEALLASLGDVREVERACDGMGTFIAMTPYAELNVLASLLAREFVGVGHARRVLLPGRDAGPRIGHVDPDDLPSFRSPIDVGAVAREIEQGRMVVSMRAVALDGTLDGDLGPEAQRLLIVRDARVHEIGHRPPRRGDRVLVLHRPAEPPPVAPEADTVKSS
jgi:hypothetical protein